MKTERSNFLKKIQAQSGWSTGITGNYAQICSISSFYTIWMFCYKNYIYTNIEILNYYNFFLAKTDAFMNMIKLKIVFSSALYDLCFEVGERSSNLKVFQNV